MIVVADADGAEKTTVFRVVRQVSRDPLPEQHERCVTSLEFESYERTPELNGIVEAFDKSALVLEQRVGVQAPHAVAGKNFIYRGKAICADNLLFLAVPQKQVKVARVEAIGVCRLSGAFAGFAEGDLAQPAELGKDIRNLVRTRIGCVHIAV